MANLSFEETLIEVWRQSLVEDVKTVELGLQRFPVRRTPKQGLRQVDFTFEDRENPRAGAKPFDEVPVGTDGQVRQKGDAVSK